MSSSVLAVSRTGKNMSSRTPFRNTFSLSDLSHSPEIGRTSKVHRNKDSVGTLASSAPLPKIIRETLEWIGISLSSYDLRRTLVASTSSLVFQKDVIGRYLVGEILGMGSYGIVKEAVDSITLRRCAVKIFIAKRIRRIPHGPENVENELKLMKNLRHENVIRVLDVTRRGEDSFMVMEHCKCNLEEMLEQCPDKKLPLTVSQNYFKQLMEGMGYLQCRRVVHMDIKPDNLLISNSNILRISDFGVAQKLDIFAESDDCTRYWGCPIIQPPEVARGDDTFSGFKLDIWCCGVTLFKLITGYYPYNAMNEFLLIKAIIEGEYSIPDWLDKSAADLISDILSYDAERRPSVDDIKKHGWMNEVYTEKQYYDEFSQCIMLKEKSILLDLLFHFHKREAVLYDQEVVENVF